MVLGAAAAIALAANKKAALKYAIAFAGLIGVFILAHFGRSIFHVQGRRGTFAKTLAVPFRYGTSQPIYPPPNSNAMPDYFAKFFFESSPRCLPADISF